ncbi:hypothetical protein COLO4_01644 [Corchorus olitorius]|uniref:Uncharacterized protein n=1 Tax=Corchorus olitorius TaxID=93759 RepID=A0A1R3L2F6_9ROSI|nr:hypothetical protein COLO4_01644 [Corchorus olitorius]
MIAVAAHPVTAGDIRLIFDSARHQQRLPVMRARGRPVSHVERQIVIVTVAGKHRKAQVVANLRQNAPAAPVNPFPAFARQIVLMLLRHTKQMAFVILMQRAVWLHQQKPVYRTRICLNGRAAADQRLGGPRVMLQPGHHLLLRQRSLRRLHGKAGCKHLRQHNHIASAQIFQQSIKMTQVSGAVHPAQRLLQQSNLQSLHRRSAAASSVASCLAKHRRISRCGKGSAQNTDSGIAATPASLVSHSQKLTSSRSAIAL